MLWTGEARGMLRTQQEATSAHRIVRSARLGFTLSNFKPGNLPNKKRARDFVRHHLVASVPTTLKTLHCLTLPGAWWHFERDLFADSTRTFRPTFLCCEMQAPLFSVAVHRMPHVSETRGICTRIASKYQHAHFASNRRDLAIFNMNVHDFVAETDARFNVIWLDLCSQTTEKLFATVKRLPSLLRPREYACVILGVAAARESLTILSEMHKYPSRLAYLAAKFNTLLGEDFVPVMLHSYRDTHPMLQLGFQRKDQS